MTDQEQASQVLLSHRSLFSNETFAFCQELIQVGQTKLFLQWDPPGIYDQSKISLIDQLVKLNQSCPLVSYFTRAKACIRTYYTHGTTFSQYDAYPPIAPFYSRVSFNNVTTPPPTALASSSTPHTQPPQPQPSPPITSLLNEPSKILTSFSDLCLLEQHGLETLHQLGFVLVAGGMGERLGYPQSKISIPFDLITNKTFIAYYCERIRSIQDRANSLRAAISPPVCLPFVIMTSDNTHGQTLQLFANNEYFGLQPHQVCILQQPVVPAFVDTCANICCTKHIAPSSRDVSYEITLKPHGHGDIHSILYSHPESPFHSGLFQRCGTKFLFFFQDTNPMAFNCLFAIIGKLRLHRAGMCTMALDRQVGDAVGGIACLLRRAEGQDRHNQQCEPPNQPDLLMINVEYTVFGPMVGKEDPLPTENIFIPDTGVAGSSSSGLHSLQRQQQPQQEQEEGQQQQLNTDLTQNAPYIRSIQNTCGEFPGNSNVFVLDLEQYTTALQQSSGIIGEFVNPKGGSPPTNLLPGSPLPCFQFSTPARLETLMQDIPLSLPCVEVTADNIDTYIGPQQPSVSTTSLLKAAHSLLQLPPQTETSQSTIPHITFPPHTVLHFPTWFSFSPAKNSLQSGREKLLKNSSPESIISCEFTHLSFIRRMLQLFQCIDISTSSIATSPCQGGYIVEPTRLLSNHRVEQGPFILPSSHCVLSPILDIPRVFAPHSIRCTTQTKLVLDITGVVPLRIERLCVDGFVWITVLTDHDRSAQALLPSIVLDCELPSNTGADFAELAALSTTPLPSDETHLPVDAIAHQEDAIAPSCPPLNHQQTLPTTATTTITPKDDIPSFLSCRQYTFSGLSIVQRIHELIASANQLGSYQEMNHFRQSFQQQQLQEPIRDDAPHCDLYLIDLRTASRPPGLVNEANQAIFNDLSLFRFSL